MQHLVTLLILAVVTTQLFVSLARPPLVSPKVVASWPFLNYPMYREAYFEGDRISHVLLLGIKQDSNEVLLSRHDLAVSEWQYRKFVNALCANDRLYADAFFRANATLKFSEFELIRVVDRGPFMTSNGLVPGPESELGRYIPYATSLKPRP